MTKRERTYLMRLKHRLTTLDARVAAKRSLHLADERAEASALRWAIDKIEDVILREKIHAAAIDIRAKRLEAGLQAELLSPALRRQWKKS